MSKFKDLTGMKFGRLTVIERAENSNTGKTRWKCKCECGKETISHTSSLTSGRTKSCGCLSHEKAVRTITKHGYRRTKLYGVWCGMKKRCYNTKFEHYDRYGGRGIKVCEEWKKDFSIFKDWSLQNGYKEGLEIDRIDVDGNYEPSNCNWKTRTEQVRNRSNTVFLTYKGEKRTLIEWCQKYKVNYKLAHSRYKKGFDFEKIFNL